MRKAVANHLKREPRLKIMLQLSKEAKRLDTEDLTYGRTLMMINDDIYIYMYIFIYMYVCVRVLLNGDVSMRELTELHLDSSNECRDHATR